MAEQKSGFDRAPPRKPEQARKRCDDGDLQRKEAEHADNDQHGLAQEKLQIDLHADGDEEESEQQILERIEVGLDLMAKFGLREQKPREKGAERH